MIEYRQTTGMTYVPLTATTAIARVACIGMLWLAGIALSACSRDKGTIYLVAPFNDSTKIGDVTATWTNTGEERAFADGKRLDAPQVKLQYAINVRSRLDDKAFVRLQDFKLMAGSEEVGKDSARVECVLPVGDSPRILTGEVWIATDRAKNVNGFEVTHFAVPLSERGRSLYREWSLQGRPDQAAAVDSEITAYASAPPCPRG